MRTEKLKLLIPDDKWTQLKEIGELAIKTETMKLDQWKDRFSHTDLGNAQRLVAAFGNSIQYCHTWGKWVVWTGSKWQIDDRGLIYNLAKQVVMNMYKEVSELYSDEARKELSRHAIKSENISRIQAMVALCRSEVPVLPNQFDKNINLINCKNGTFNLETGTLQQHNEKDYIMMQTAIDYNRDAECPMWISFLNIIMAGRQDLIHYLQKAIGYALTGSTKEQTIFILFGAGANGKSTFLETIKSMLDDYAKSCPIDTFMIKNGTSIPNDIARLRGARFVSASEVEEGKRLAESLIKQMTGGERLTARFMRSEYFEYEPHFKIFLTTNHKPQIRGNDNGIWRRIQLIPFEVTIPVEQQDKDLMEKLRVELPGIFNWAVEGCKLWQNEGLNPPQEVIKSTENYRQEQDIIQRFLDECCEVKTDNSKLNVQSSRLYESYVKYCREIGDNEISQKAFTNRLQERGYIKRKSTRNIYWYGIGLLN